MHYLCALILPLLRDEHHLLYRPSGHYGFCHIGGYGR